MTSKLRSNLRVPLGGKVQELNDTVAAELRRMTKQDTLAIFGAAGKVHIQRECNKRILTYKCNRTRALHGSVITSSNEQTKLSIKAKHRH